MRELQLQEIKDLEISVLRHFDAFCREHGIRYFLSNGTLLGAVKYQGFIPWDDDIDVLVPREDYDRFIARYDGGKEYSLLCAQRDENFPFPYAKLCDTSTVVEWQTTLKNYKCGVHIDIVPLDYWASEVKRAKKEADKTKRLLNAYCFSFSKFIKGKTFARSATKNVLIAWTHMVGCRFYQKKLKKQITKSMSLSQKECCGCW